VLEAVGPRPSIVCRVRSCIAPGLAVMVAAAAARFEAASLSPSALMIVVQPRWQGSAASVEGRFPHCPLAVGCSTTVGAFLDYCQWSPRADPLLPKTARDYDERANAPPNSRRGGRVADRTGLENRHRRKAVEGSNPSPSA